MKVLDEKAKYSVEMGKFLLILFIFLLILLAFQDCAYDFLCSILKTTNATTALDIHESSLQVRIRPNVGEKEISVKKTSIIEFVHYYYRTFNIRPRKIK